MNVDMPRPFRPCDNPRAANMEVSTE